MSDTVLTERRGPITIEQEGLDEDEAMRREFARGQASVRADTVAGATRFASGAGRHGSFG